MQRVKINTDHNLANNKWRVSFDKIHTGIHFLEMNLGNGTTAFSKILLMD